MASYLNVREKSATQTGGINPVQQTQQLSETDKNTYSFARKFFEGLALVLMNLTIIGAIFNLEMLRGDKSWLKEEYERVFLDKEITVVERSVNLSNRKSPDDYKNQNKHLDSIISPSGNSNEGVNVATQTASSTDKIKIRQELLKHEKINKDHIDSIIDIIEEIVSKSTVLGQPISYDEQGMAYLRKNENIPFTLQVYTNGIKQSVYIHFKSKKAGQCDLINEACQKKVYRAINQSGEFYAASVIHERLEDTNSSTFETEKKALEIFKGCPYILRGFHASSYPKKDPDKGEKYGLITEYCEGAANGEFFDRLSLKERWTFFLHTLEGVKAMHDKGYCHFDLKGDNILHKTVDGVSEPRIIDFGVMHQMGEILETGARGAYLPPEYMVHENFPIKVTEKVDVWALGQYAAIEFLGIHPQVEYDFVLDNGGNYVGKKGKLNVDWSEAPNEMRPFVSIITQMLNCDPVERISMDSAIEQIRTAVSKL